MLTRRFQAPDGRFIRAVMTSADGEPFTTDADGIIAAHEAGYGVAPLKLIEQNEEYAEADPYAGYDVIDLPPRPPTPDPVPTFEELVAQASTFAELKKLVAEQLA